METFNIVVFCYIAGHFHHVEGFSSEYAWLPTAYYEEEFAPFDHIIVQVRWKEYHEEGKIWKNYLPDDETYHYYPREEFIKKVRNR